MFQSFSRSWALIKASYNVLRSDPELLLLPLFSMIGVAMVSAVFFVPYFFTNALGNFSERGENGGLTPLGAVILFLFYLASYTITIYCNVGIAGAALKRLRGEDPSLGDALSIANSHITQIVGYAAISATVGLLLSFLRDRNGIIGRIIAAFISVAWNVVTFMVVPVLVVENVRPIEAIKRSGSLLRRTWGEQAIGSGGVGLVLGLLVVGLVLVIGLPLFLLALSIDSLALLFGTIALMVLLVGLISLFGAALNGVYQVALYNYATTGQAGQYFDANLLQTAFKAKVR